MPEIPQEAVQAATEALAEYGTEPYGDLRLNAERAAAKAVCAAAPFLTPSGETPSGCGLASGRHAYAHYKDPGSLVFVAVCVSCHVINWADLAEQITAIRQEAAGEERARIVAQVRERLEEAAKVVLEHQWGHVSGTTHARHDWDSDCAVCRGDVAAILAVAWPVLVGRDG